MLRLALDTNCLIAALTKQGGTCARLVRAWLGGAIEVVASEATVREAERVMGGGWLDRIAGREAVEDLLAHLRSRSVWADRPVRINDLHLKDEGDLRLVETAVAGGASLVATTDREFLSHRGYDGVEFVTPQEAWRRLLEAG